jgi:hypothetical protein
MESSQPSASLGSGVEALLDSPDTLGAWVVRIWRFQEVLPPSSTLRVVLRNVRLADEDPEANRNCDRLPGRWLFDGAALGRLFSIDESETEPSRGCSSSLLGPMGADVEGFRTCSGYDSIDNDGTAQAAPSDSSKKYTAKHHEII